MTRIRSSFLASAAALPVVALAVSACGGGSSATAAAPLPKTNGQTPTIGVGKTSLGNILINSQGRTVYLFKADSGTKSACNGACAAAWPPLQVTGKPVASRGAKASLVGTTTRSNGSKQVTYNGHPVYLFARDQQPGQTNGQGVTAFGAAWFALTPSGTQVSAQPASSPAPSGSGSTGY